MQRRTFALSLPLIALAGTARAQAYPGKVIRCIVPVAPGGGSDMVGRYRHRALGQSARAGLRGLKTRATAA